MIRSDDKFLNKLLEAYNLSYEQYLELSKDVTYDDLEDPYDFLGISEAKERINKAANSLFYADGNDIGYHDSRYDVAATTEIYIKTIKENITC